VKRLIITGPTAGGKGRLAAELARRLNGEIVSIDSMKIYRRMNVGTAKPSASLRREIPFHLLDIVDPWQDFSVGDFLPRVLESIREIESRGRRAILQGGTALYLKALMNGLFVGPEADWKLRDELEEEARERGLDALHAELSQLDPERAREIYPQDRRRIIRALEVVRGTGSKMSELWQGESLKLEEGSYVCFGIERPRQTLYERIDRRVEVMVTDGLFEETEQLLAGPRGFSRAASKCLGYRQIIEGMMANEPRQETVARIQRDTRRFAKQQLTWFRRFPIKWLTVDDSARMTEVVARALDGRKSTEGDQSE
jgi:tRNA dimethylallyltransferase